MTEFDEDRPVPYGYTRVNRARKGLIIGGAVTFGVTYAIAMLTAAAGDDLNRSGESTTNLDALWIPGLGPFILLGQTDSTVGRVWLIQWGLAQSAGAIMLVYGLTNPKTILVRSDQLSVAPMIAHGASGLMVTGRF
jgi:hypothetical protein